MLYLTDANTDESRPRPDGYEGAGPELLSEFCPDLYVPTIRSWGLPAWNRFLDELVADEDLVKQLIKECRRIPVPVIREGLLVALREAVAPVEIVTD